MTLLASAEVLTQRGALASVNSGQIGSAADARDLLCLGQPEVSEPVSDHSKTASVRVGRSTGPWAVELIRKSPRIRRRSSRERRHMETSHREYVAARHASEMGNSKSRSKD